MVRLKGCRAKKVLVTSFFKNVKILNHTKTCDVKYNITSLIVSEPWLGW